MNILKKKFDFSVSTGGVKFLPFESTIKSFSKNNINNIAFNLTPIIDNKIKINNAKSIMEDNNIFCSMLDGGWCDFINKDNFNNKTKKSIKNQVKIAHILNTNKIRLFFGKFNKDMSQEILESCIYNIDSICTMYPNINFVFENENGISTNLDFLSSIISNVSNKNFGINFDTVNFERNKINPLEAYYKLKSKIQHFHIKSKIKNKIVEYGIGDSKIDEIIQIAINEKIFNSFSIEYEGDKNRLKMLTKSAYLLQERLDNGYFK